MPFRLRPIRKLAKARVEGSKRDRRVLRLSRGVTLGASACSSVEERRPSKPRVGGSNPSRRVLDALAESRPTLTVKHPSGGLRFDTLRQRFDMHRSSAHPVDMPSPSRRSAKFPRACLGQSEPASPRHLRRTVAFRLVQSHDSSGDSGSVLARSGRGGCSPFRRGRAC